MKLIKFSAIFAAFSMLLLFSCTPIENTQNNSEDNSQKTMFMGFENVIYIEENTSADEMIKKISSLTTDTTVKVYGKIDDVKLAAIKYSMTVNSGIKLALDFSDSTGITEWKNWFAGTETLHAISLPNTVTTLQEDIFEGCTNLKALTVPCSIDDYPDLPYDYTKERFYTIVNFSGTLTDWLNSSVVIYVYEKFYLNGKQPVDITIPNSITKIRNFAFRGCDLLAKVTIPDSVKSIGEDAFESCVKLKDIKIPDSVTTIESAAFFGCTGLKNVTLPSGIKRIEDSMFYGCTGLERLTIPDSVTSIGNCAFYQCYSLADVTIPESVTDIGGDAFYCCNLKSVAISGTVTKIGGGAFLNCSNLKEVIIEDGDTELTTGSVCFGGCPLEKLYVGRNLSKSSSIHPFDYRNSTLASLVIGNKVTEIIGYEFADLYGLTDVTMPDGVVSIGSGAFQGCKSLATVNYKGSEEQWKLIDISYSNQPLTEAAIVYSYKE